MLKEPERQPKQHSHQMHAFLGPSTNPPASAVARGTEDTPSMLLKGRGRTSNTWQMGNKYPLDATPTYLMPTWLPTQQLAHRRQQAWLAVHFGRAACAARSTRSTKVDFRAMSTFAWQGALAGNSMYVPFQAQVEHGCAA